MKKLNWYIEKSGKSSFYRWLLNVGMNRIIPFNAPHGLRIIKIQPGHVHVFLPYRKNNLNHLKGIHACALATLCEYTIGLTLVTKLGDDKFRFIMKNLAIEYHYQARMNVSTEFSLDDNFINSRILEPLVSDDAVLTDLEIKVSDASGNHICTGRTQWQIKKWQKVQVKP